jgi:hypothetical protein
MMSAIASPTPEISRSLPSATMRASGSASAVRLSAARGFQVGKSRGRAAHRVKKLRNVIRLLQSPAIEIIAPSE